MALSLTCDCGARFEVEDTLAGQTVACPECQEPIKAPAAQRPPLRTSALALASCVCALVGAFTVVGTIAAVVLGVVAVVSILRHRDRLAGLAFASFGIVAGVLFTGLTVLAFSKVEAFGMGNWARAQALAPIVDDTGPMEVTRAGYAITRPSETWGVLTAMPRDPLVKAMDNKSDLSLVDMRTYAFIDVKVDSLTNRTLIEYQSQMIAELCPPRKPWEPPDDGPNASVITKAVPISGAPVSTRGADFSEREFVIEVGGGRQTWHMLVHLYLNTRTKMLYVVRCYAPKAYYERMQTDFRSALDSFTPKR